MQRDGPDWREDSTSGEAADFSAELTQLSGTPVVVLRGELDMDSAAIFQRVVGALLDDDVSDVALDMSEITFIDSGGIALLVAVQKLLRAEGRRLVVRSPSERALRLLQICDLVDYLHVVVTKNN